MMSAPLALFTPLFARFLLSGGLNTVLTYGLYLLLLMAFSYTASFSMAYAAGILFAYVMNRFFVFKRHQGLKSIIWLPFVYILQYVLSMIVLWGWVEKWQFSVHLAPLAAIAVTLPVTYFFSRLLF